MNAVTSFTIRIIGKQKKKVNRSEGTVIKVKCLVTKM